MVSRVMSVLVRECSSVTIDANHALITTKMC